jgi:putative oxidoreductase
MTITVNIALLILRVVVGLVIVAHGILKLRGWSQARPGYEHMGFKPGWFWLGLNLLGEIGGGASLALGFLTPVGAAGIFGAMFMALFKVHWKKGFWINDNGYEYTLVLLVISLTFGLIGGGAYSLDTLFGITLPNALVFGVFALAALIVDVIGIFISNNQTVPTPAKNISPTP